MKRRQAMNIRYAYTLLTLIIALYFVPVQAQTKHKAPAKKQAAKKQAVKPAKKKPAKTSKAAQKTNAKNLGDAAAKANTDTTKTGGKANQPQKIGNSLSEEIVVTTAYKPVLADAVKIRRNPDLEDKTPFKAPLSYNTIDQRLEKDNEIRPLVAMKKPAERDSILLNNYLKVGLGNLKTTFGEAYFGNGKDQALQIGGYLKHLAQQGSALYKQNSAKEEVGVFGKSIGADNTISGRADYSYRSNYFYGYNPSVIPLVNNPAKQHFSTLGGEVELAKNFKDVENDFTYALKLKGYTFSNAYQAKENNVVLSGFLNQTIKQFYAGVSTSLDFTTQQDSLYDHNNSLIRVNPYIKFQGENYKVDAGVNIVDEFGFSSRFFIFPAAKAELQVIPKYVRLFVEAKGDVNRSSIRDFSEINPFIGQNIAIKNSVDQLDISAGLKGTLAPGLGFKAAIYRNSIKNLPLLVSDPDNQPRKFEVIYDNGKAQVSGFTGELDYKASEDFNLFGRVEFKDYKLASEAQAWNLPKFLLTAGTRIHINDKVTINGSLIYRGTAYDRSTAPVPANVLFPAKITINAFADVSGGVEYKVNHKISIFVQANNLLNTSNQTWLYYPNYGFNIFGGVGFGF
jgi:hypothetical protein